MPEKNSKEKRRKKKVWLYLYFVIGVRHEMITFVFGRFRTGHTFL
jgi:hypothetical protein